MIMVRISGGSVAKDVGGMAGDRLDEDGGGPLIVVVWMTWSINA